MPYGDIRGLDVAMLRTFDALMREGSVSRAAARLFLGQPAVSASLKRLRDTFGDPLFVRQAHGVAPTPRAIQLWPRVEALLADLQALVAEEIAFDPAGSERIVRLSGSDVSSHDLLAPLCGLLASRGSRMRISWELADHERLPERLRKGDVDLGLLPRLSPIAGLQSRLLFEDDYVMVHRRSDGDAPTGIDAFCGRPHVTLAQTRTTLDDAIDLALSRKGHRRHIQAAVTTFGQMADVIEHSDLVAVFPRRAARRYASTLAASPLPFELPVYRLHLCWDTRAESDRPVMWLRDRIVDISAGEARLDLPAAQIGA